MAGDKQTDMTEIPSPEERHEEFSKENGRWNSEMEEALEELDELAQESDPGSSKSEQTPA
jgi:hypothetical protein